MYLENHDNGHSFLPESQLPIVMLSHFGFVKFRSSMVKKHSAKKEKDFLFYHFLNHKKEQIFEMSHSSAYLI